MKVKALITAYGLTEGKIYSVIFEYDSVYDVELNDGRQACRSKSFFEVVKS